VAAAFDRPTDEPGHALQYTTSCEQLARFLAERGMPTSLPVITREHVEAFVTDLPERWKPAIAHNRYRALNSSFRWLVDESLSLIASALPPDRRDFSDRAAAVMAGTDRNRARGDALATSRESRGHISGLAGSGQRRGIAVEQST